MPIDQPTYEPREQHRVLCINGPLRGFEIPVDRNSPTFCVPLPIDARKFVLYGAYYPITPIAVEYVTYYVHHFRAHNREDLYIAAV